MHAEKRLSFEQSTEELVDLRARAKGYNILTNQKPVARARDATISDYKIFIEENSS